MLLCCYTCASAALCLLASAKRLWLSSSSSPKAAHHLMTNIQTYSVFNCLLIEPGHLHTTEFDAVFLLCVLYVLWIYCPTQRQREVMVCDKGSWSELNWDTYSTAKTTRCKPLKPLIFCPYSYSGLSHSESFCIYTQKRLYCSVKLSCIYF